MEASLVAATDAWHARRLADLRSPHGWLSLVDGWGLFEGDNDLPIGRATVAGKRVHLVPSAPLARADGAAVGEVDLGPGDSLFEGARRWDVREVGGELLLRLRDPDSPYRSTFVDIPRFPVSDAFRVPGRIAATGVERTAQVYKTGARVDVGTPGELVLSLGGREHRLEVSFEGERRLHLAFADETTGIETYPTGRFLYIPWDGVPDVVVDFNRAFNPPCALTPVANCPLVPEGNRLGVRIEAGEKQPVFAG